MGDAFDPYREWLGISAGKPSTYYGLFGIELFEGDTGVIAHAADSLRTRIRSIRPGGHLAEWQGLLDEVAAGKSCLLNPDTKVSYDAKLRGWALPPLAGPSAAEPIAAIPAGDGQPQMAVPPGATSSPRRWTESRDPISPVAIPATRTAADSRLMATPPSSQNQDPTRTFSPMSYAMPSTEQTPPSYPPPLPSSRQPGSLPRDQADSSSVAMAAVPMSQTMQAPAESPSVNALQEAIQSSGVPRSRMSTNTAMALVLPILVVVSLGSVGYVFFRDYQLRHAGVGKGEEGEGGQRGEGERGRGADDVKKAESPKVASPAVSLSSPVVPGPSAPAKIELAQASPGPMTAAKPAAPADPQKQAALKKALADARTALANRDLDTAKKCVEQASQNAQSEDDRNDVARIDNLTKWVASFWELIVRRITQFRPTDEIEVGKTRVAVVEAGADALVIKAEGQVRRYTVASLPTPLVTALAEQTLSKDPASKIVFACFLLVDRHGDRQRARQLIAEAAQKGENAEPLMPSLDSFGDALAASGGSETAKAALDPAKVLQAESLVKQRFQDDFDAATTLTRKADLARKLVKAEPRSQDSVETQVAQYHVALELAVAAGKPDVVLQAADRIADVGGGDALETKVAALEALVRGARSVSVHRDVVLNALKLGPQAITLGRAAEAGRLARLAAESAKKSQSPGLMRQAKAFAQQAAELEHQAKTEEAK